MNLESSGDDDLGSGMEDINLIPRLDEFGSGEGSGESNLVPRFDIEDLGSGVEDMESHEAEIKLVDEDFEGSGGDFRAAELSDGSGEEFVKIVEEMEDVTEAGSGELRFVEISSGEEDVEEEIIAKIEEVDDSMEANTEDVPVMAEESEEGVQQEVEVEADDEEIKEPRTNFTPLQKIKETVVSTAKDIKDAKVNVVEGALKAKQDILQAKKDFTKHFKRQVSKFMRRAWARSFE